MNQAPLPAKRFLLDIEGTTSSISFVHDVMFPFALNNLESFLSEHFETPDVVAACQQIAKDAGREDLDTWADSLSLDSKTVIIQEVQRLMANDVKATGLKALQGLIWKGGFDSGELRAHIYPDVIPSIKRWRAEAAQVRIYSSGSIAAQKMFFGNLDGEGDCLDLFCGHYDTTIGGKKEPASYVHIAQDWQCEPAEILFVSDIVEELEAADSVGVQTRLSIRPGNHPVAEDVRFTKIDSFEAI